jgi:hypothetical protein
MLALLRAFSNSSLITSCIVGDISKATQPLNDVWTDHFMALGAGIYATGLLSLKEIELLSVLFEPLTLMCTPLVRGGTSGTP